MNPSSPTTEDSMLDPLERTVEQFITRVLHRAHQAALVVDAPDEARAILELAQAFADEMATAITGFDRTAFIAAVTEDVS